MINSLASKTSVWNKITHCWYKKCLAYSIMVFCDIPDYIIFLFCNLFKAPKTWGLAALENYNRSGTVEQVKVWGANFYYEIWEVEVKSQADVNCE